MSYWLASSSKCQYLESYDIKCDFHDFKFYNLVQSKKNTDLTAFPIFSRKSKSGSERLSSLFYHGF